MNPGTSHRKSKHLNPDRPTVCFLPIGASVINISFARVSITTLLLSLQNAHTDLAVKNETTDN